MRGKEEEGGKCREEDEDEEEEEKEVEEEEEEAKVRPWGCSLATRSVCPCAEPETEGGRIEGKSL